MCALTPKTPGVYIDEINAFGNAVVPISTAVPAFIGYTPKASYQGQSYTNVPTKITSFAYFQAFFCYPDPTPPAPPAKQYDPQYYLVAQKSQPEKGDYLLIDGTYYSIVPDPNTIYYLYNSIRLFYENGGGTAYIVSVGTYGDQSGKGMTPGDQIVNPNVQYKDLLGGLTVLKQEQEPTMYVCPEATLLSVADNSTLMQQMLLQCAEMQTAISIFDVIGARNPDPILFTEDIKAFRDNVGTQNLNYGVAYYPFVGTTIMQHTDIDYTNLFGNDIKQLKPLISPASAPNSAVETILGNIEKPTGTPLTSYQYSNALINASKTYQSIIKHVLSDANLLPPSGGMAGVMTTTDNQRGVWFAPANVSIVGVATLPISITHAQQENLNVDPISGKSINAIRAFTGRGNLVWGARTLEGNSQDWRYINVRRTMIFIEQSCKLATRPYVFEPNDTNTWKTITGIISNFLHNLWAQGALAGRKPAEAYTVACGLGKTMTGQDILDGTLRVAVKVALVRPAEFIIITFEQEQATS